MSAIGEDAGFTLLEMMVTIAILALISGIGFPALQNLMARQTLTQARGAVALAVARARSQAVRRDAPMRVTLADRGPNEGRALVISGAAPEPLPAGTVLEWPRGGVTIFGDGSSSGASGTLRAGALATRFAIDPATARLEFGS